MCNMLPPLLEVFLKKILLSLNRCIRLDLLLNVRVVFVYRIEMFYNTAPVLKNLIFHSFSENMVQLEFILAAVGGMKNGCALIIETSLCKRSSDANEKIRQ